MLDAGACEPDADDSPAAADAPARAGAVRPAPPPGVPFLERRRGQCAWPLWDEATARDERTVCGAPTGSPGASWCPRHARVVHAPPPEADFVPPRRSTP